MISHHTKFSWKRFSSSEDILESKFHPSLWPWPWRQETNLFERQSGSWWSAPSYQVWSQKIQWFRNIIWTNILWHFAVTQWFQWHLPPLPFVNVMEGEGYENKTNKKLQIMYYDNNFTKQHSYYHTYAHTLAVFTCTCTWHSQGQLLVNTILSLRLMPDEPLTANSWLVTITIPCQVMRYAIAKH